MTVTEKLRALRVRSGLSKRQVAVAAGWKGGSSYQRYENADLYSKPYLPLDICLRLVPALVGRGVPRITREEVLELAGVGQAGGAAALEAALAALSEAAAAKRYGEALGHALIVAGQLVLINKR